jgi:4-amino-4-deoxy-L-arabinose transferase-like glycosyltransferase
MAASTLQPAAPDETQHLHPTADEQRVNAPAPNVHHDRRGRFLRGTTLAALLVGTAVLYLWGLSASGYANSFYSAAAQAGSQSWKAFIFGSLDAGNAITVDEPPASLWLMALSARIFGLSSWSILAPQALLGVATVAVLYASVRCTSGHLAGLTAGALLALTPAAVLMFRFNNPDALLVFLLTAAAYCTLRATEDANGRWLAGAGVLIGIAFLSKMLQAFLVLPAFALVYLLAAPAPLRKRFFHLLIAFVTMIVSLGWWVAIVELVPASMRPYVGGSANNSVLDLIFGYNGPGRIFGNDGGGDGGAPGGHGGMWGTPGITRLFDGVSGGMIAWLIPAALVLAVFAMILLSGARRINTVRAAIMVWTGWLLVTGLVFSFTAGIYHDYYTIALAPSIAALVAVSGHALWRERHRWLARVGLTLAAALTGVTGLLLIDRAPEPYNALTWVIAGASLVAVVGFLVGGRLPKALATGLIAVALVGGGVGPSAYALQTAMTPSEAPVGGGEGSASTQVATLLRENASAYTWVAATNGSQTAARYQLATQSPVMAIGGFNGGDPAPTLEEFQALVSKGQIHYYLAGDNGGPGGAQRSGSQIVSWVAKNFSASTVDGVTLYDLTASQ